MAEFFKAPKRFYRTKEGAIVGERDKDRVELVCAKGDVLALEKARALGLPIDGEGDAKERVSLAKSR